MHTRARAHPMNTTLTRADKVGAEGFEPPSTGLEPVVLPGYTIPPRQYIGLGDDISTERWSNAPLTACSACGQLGGGGVSCDATSIADCRPSSRHDFPASLIRPTCSPYMSKSGDSEDESGRYRIRTRVLGLEIQGDIQATLTARNLARSLALHEVHLNGRAHFGHRDGDLTVVRSQTNPQ